MSENEDELDKARIIDMRVVRPMLGPDGKAAFVEVLKVGACRFCGQEFYIPGDENWEKTHFQNNKPLQFQKGDVINLQVDMLKGPYKVGTAYKGPIKIVKVYPAGDYFFCQHRYLIEILDKGQERALLDWWGMLEVSGGDEFMSRIENETGLVFEDFLNLWDARNIDLPPKIKEELLTIQERILRFWQCDE